MNLPLLLLLPALTWASPVVTTPGVPPGNFSLSCTSINLRHGFFLGATCCRPATPGTADAESDNQLDLTMCIGLDQVEGKMQWEV